MRENLRWEIGAEDFTSLNTRVAKDRLAPGELSMISNFSYDELGGLKKARGNELVYTSSVDYYIQESDTVVIGKGTITVTLPPAAGNEDLFFWIGNEGDGIITIDTQDGDLIFIGSNEKTQKKLFGNGNFVRIISDGDDWHVMGQNFPVSGTKESGLAGIPKSGYLECDGSAISRTLYDELFDAIGTRYGIGDGATTFNLPDLRGLFDRHWDHGAGVDPNADTRQSPYVGFVITGDTLVASPVITDVSDTSQLYEGLTVSGVGIAAGSKILSIDTINQITLDTPCTANGNDVSLTITLEGDYPGTTQQDAIQDHYHRSIVTNEPDEFSTGSDDGVDDSESYDPTSGVEGANTAPETRPKNFYTIGLIKA